MKVISVCRNLYNEKREYHISRQLLPSGTSIGANIEEAIGGSSRNDFKAKLDIAHKEARETRYWLHLLKDSDLLSQHEAEILLDNCEELIRILASILKTLKQTPLLS